MNPIAEVTSFVGAVVAIVLLVPWLVRRFMSEGIRQLDRVDKGRDQIVHEFIEFLKSEAKQNAEMRMAEHIAIMDEMRQFSERSAAQHKEITDAIVASVKAIRRVNE